MAKICLFLHIKNTYVSKIYATYSMMTGLLSTIAVGILLLLIVSVIVITIVIWFPDDQSDDQSTAFDEVRNPKFLLQLHNNTGEVANP